MSFMKISNNIEGKIESAKIETIDKSIALDSEIPNDGCWWDETYGSNFSGKRGSACGSDTSLKIWFTNPYSYSIRVAFYFRDSYGNYGPNAPYVVTIKPGATRYHHSCYSNGRYVILAARADDYCSFPDLD